MRRLIKQLVKVLGHTRALPAAGAADTSMLLLALLPVTCTLQDLFVQLDSRLPHGDYRIPSLVATPSGTLLAFVMGRMHRTDYTPNIVYLRRSIDDGATWSEAEAILSDPHNRTMFGGVPVVDPSTGTVTFVHNQAVLGDEAMRCSGCMLWGMTSTDDGATWSVTKPLNVTGPANATWGGGLASGITLTKGRHAGRMMVALRHDCGCGDLRTSFVVYSDDHGATWQGGEELVLLPQFGGGWTECEVAGRAHPGDLVHQGGASSSAHPHLHLHLHPRPGGRAHQRLGPPHVAQLLRPQLRIRPSPLRSLRRWRCELGSQLERRRRPARPILRGLAAVRPRPRHPPLWQPVARAPSQLLGPRL